MLQVEDHEELRIARQTCMTKSEKQDPQEESPDQPEEQPSFEAAVEAHNHKVWAKIDAHDNGQEQLDSSTAKDIRKQRPKSVETG